MATVKVKFRASLVPGKEGTLYYHLIHQASSQPRATPWVSVHKRLRPVRAKVWANGWLLLLPLQGVGNGDMVPRALPCALDLLGFQPAQGRRQGFFRIIFTNLIFQF